MVPLVSHQERLKRERLEWNEKRFDIVCSLLCSMTVADEDCSHLGCSLSATHVCYLFMCEETEPVHASTHFHETGCCVVDSLLNHVNNVEDDSGTVLVTRDSWFYSKKLSFS